MLLFTFKASNVRVLISMTWAFPQRVFSSVLTGRMSPGYTGLKTVEVNNFRIRSIYLSRRHQGYTGHVGWKGVSVSCYFFVVYTVEPHLQIPGLRNANPQRVTDWRTHSVLPKAVNL